MKVNSSLIVGLTYTDTTVADGTVYTYYATSVDSGGSESTLTSNVVEAKIPATGIHSVTLTWTASTSTVAGYNMYRDVLQKPGQVTGVKTKVD